MLAAINTKITVSSLVVFTFIYFSHLHCASQQSKAGKNGIILTIHIFCVGTYNNEMAADNRIVCIMEKVTQISCCYI